MPLRYWVACLLFVSLATVYIGLIVYLDNTNLSTTNGLWKSPWVRAWELGTGRPIDSGGLLYLPTYGFLCGLIPDGAVSYGDHGEIVTYRKMAMLNAFFSALASSAVFLLALRFTASVSAALLVAFAHASTGFVLLHSINSEDVTPAYAFFVLAVLNFFGYVQTRKFRWLVLCAGFLALTTVFHWTLMIPAVAAVGVAQLVLVMKREHPAWSLVAFPLVFLAMIGLATVFANLLYPDISLSPWQILYPAKAGPSGWLGFGWNKLIYSSIGIGNYYLGAQQLTDYRTAFRSSFLVTMGISWLYFLVVLGASISAWFSRRTSGDLRLLAGFCGLLFGVGELEHLYSQPQDPQSQLQPMFLSIAGLILILGYLRVSLKRRGFRLATASLAVVSVGVGLWNVKLLAAYRGWDSQYVAAVKELARLFPPDKYTRVSHVYEAWNTWWYVEVDQGNWGDFHAKNIHLLSPFLDHAGISAAAAAEMVKGRVAEAFASGQRVVACSLWVQEKAEFAGMMTTVIDGARAGAYYDALRGAFRTGRTWDTPVGRFVELLPAGDSAHGDAWPKPPRAEARHQFRGRHTRLPTCDLLTIAAAPAHRTVTRSRATPPIQETSAQRTRHGVRPSNAPCDEPAFPI